MTSYHCSYLLLFSRKTHLQFFESFGDCLTFGSFWIGGVLLSGYKYPGAEKTIQSFYAAVSTSYNSPAEAICLFQGYPFTTSGRGKRESVKFTYVVSKPGGLRGQRYEGENVEGYGNEFFIDGREKEISRSSVDYALKVALEETVNAPKQLKIYGASYVYAIFRRFGVV